MGFVRREWWPGFWGFSAMSAMVGFGLWAAYNMTIGPWAHQRDLVISSDAWISATTPADFVATDNQLTFGMPLNQVKGLAKPAGTGNCSVVGVAGVDAAGKAKSDALMLLCESTKGSTHPVRRMIEGSLVDAKNVSFGLQLAKRGDQWVLPKGTVLNFQVSKEGKL